MRAVVMERFGPPDVLQLREVPDPVPGPGQVLIAVEAAGIPFIDTRIRAGEGPTPQHHPELPTIPGNGVGGTVVAVGPGVDGADLVERRVVSTTGRAGGYAELVAVSADEPVAIPDGLGMADAVALLADGRTALGLTRAAAPAQGEWVLVEAAGGGMGTLLVQLAADAGARVIGAAGSAEKRALAGRSGAEVTVDYTVPDWAERVLEATGGVGVNVVFDGVGGSIGAAAFAAVRPGGRFCIHGMASGSFTVVPEGDAERKGRTVVGLWTIPSAPEQLRELIADALELGAAGRLRPTIGQTFSLERAADAHAAIEARLTIGKTLLIP